MLDAWKAGETPEDLAKRSPPIHVKDVDWSGGFRLVSYKAGDEGKLVGYDMNYPVVLELKSPKGKSVKKTAVYTVTTQPEAPHLAARRLTARGSPRRTPHRQTTPIPDSGDRPDESSDRSFAIRRPAVPGPPGRLPGGGRSAVGHPEAGRRHPHRN